MTLINTDGMVLIGPGSEWFWTMISGIVVAVTLLGLYFQLRMQRGAAAIEQLDAVRREWTSERLARYQLEVLVALRASVDPALLPSGSSTGVANFWEKVAALAREGHLNMRLLSSMSGTCRTWWAILAPMTGRLRSEGMPGVYRDFEWLATELARRDGQAGEGQLYDEAMIAAMRERLIPIVEDAIRVEEELRAVTVRPMSTATLTPDSAP